MRDTELTAILVTVPEAPLDEDNGRVFRKDNIRLSRQPLFVKAKAKPSCVQDFSNGNLRLCILRSDARHHLASF